MERSWNGTEVVSETKNIDAAAVPSDGSMTGGWHYLNSDVSRDSRVESITGDVNLILGDGHTLDVKGLYVPAGSTLTIYGQSDGENAGKIISTPIGGAGIGGYSEHDNGNIVIHGGIIEATGYDHCAGIGSNDGMTGGAITIYGGTITAKGGSDGAGIGGGRNCEGGNITIYGGEITAKGGGENGAGIGGGDSADGGTIEIWGGVITANEDPNEDGAGIGGGDAGNGGSITIHGGTITCWSRDGAGIGGGDDGDGGTITINGGTITCHDEGAAQGARIGGGCDGDGGSITVNGGTVYTYCRDGAGIGGGEDGDGGTIKITGGELHCESASGSEGNGAAIGGGNHSGKGGKITITGGLVYAISNHSAGIGGGRAKAPEPLHNTVNSGDGGTIVISGGEVHAKSLQGSYGIGAGAPSAMNDKYDQDIGSAGNITISQGAKIYSYGNLAGIGGDSGTINIKGGELDLGLGDCSTYCCWGYGIYMFDDNAKVNISGGKVTATGYGRRAGISVEHGEVSITGGEVIATSKNGPGFGGPIDFDNENNSPDCDGKLIIEGRNTVVRAKSTNYSAIAGHSWSNSKIIVRDGATVETISGDKSDNKNTFYEGARVKAGDSKSSAVILAAGKRNTTYKNYKYVLVEFCDHEGTLDAGGKCSACEWQLYHSAYVERAWNGTAVTETEKDSPEGTVTFPLKNNTDIPGGWYYLNKDITVDDRISFQGDTHLILGDGFTLDVRGLYILKGRTLTIYAQSDGEGAGRIYSHPSSGAAIGGYSGHDNGNIVIHGGIIEATGYDHCAGIGSNDGRTGGAITIYGGTVTAKGGSDGAGIGGGRDCDGGTITIYGGDITANGPTDSDCCENGAGIGGGRYGSGGTIAIYGGTVTTYSRDGAGIGGGDDGEGGSITIHGGTITSTKVNQGQGARIGGGCDGAPGTITINGGTITTEGGSGSGIGGGKRNKSGGSVTINGGVITASGDYGIGSGEEGADVSITMGYTDATKNTISVTAVNYGGTVTLNDDFVPKDTDIVIREGEYTDTSQMAGRTLIPYEIEDQDPVVIIKSANVEFQGKIQLLFTLSFPESVLADESAYVTFEKAGTITRKPVSEGTAKGNGLAFVIPVPAPEYADQITVKVYDGGGNPLRLESAGGTDYTENGFVYSVKQYAQNKAENGSTEQMRALAKALDNYGTAAQIYFRYGDYSGLSADAAVTAVTPEDLAPYALTTSGTKPAGVTGASIVVAFDTDNTLRVTFKTDGSRALGDYTFLLDGTETVPKKSGKNGYLQVKNIAAPNLDTSHTFTVTDGTDTYTVTASALSYGYTSVKNGNEERQNLGKALYLYNRAADANFGS